MNYVVTIPNDKLDSLGVIRKAELLGQQYFRTVVLFACCLWGTKHALITCYSMWMFAYKHFNSWIANKVKKLMPSTGNCYRVLL